MNAPTLLLIVKSGSAPARETALAMAQWLKKRGVAATVQESRVGEHTLRQIAHGMSGVVVLGGDGAMLETARALCGEGLPLLGVNFGRVGFLTECEPDAWEASLCAMLEGQLSRESYCALAWELCNPDGQLLKQGYAVNDVVAGRGSLARTIALTLRIDGVLLSHCRCDGIVISTALGATGYAVSAGGPLLFPSLAACVITPLSPFAGAFPPVVVPAGALIEMSSPEGSEVYLTLDGQEPLPLEKNHTLNVRCLPGQVNLLTHDPAWYLKRLNQRGFILPGPGAYRGSGPDISQEIRQEMRQEQV